MIKSVIEACAQLCDDLDASDSGGFCGDARQCAEAIRALGSALDERIAAGPHIEKLEGDMRVLRELWDKNSLSAFSDDIDTLAKIFRHD